MPTSMVARLNNGTKRIPAAWDWVLTALFIAAMARWSWLTWPDPTIDFGREAYVPWRLSEGAVLYRDIAYHNGPLSPYLNALLFRIFGPSLHVLFAFNGLVLLCMLCLVHAWCRRLTGRVGALTASLIFLLLFAFARFLPYGNYNWMAPYSHEMTHGLFLSLGSLFCLAFSDSTAKARIVLAGGLAGLVFLAKCEIFAALAMTMAVLLALRAWTAPSLRNTAGTISLLTAGFVLPLLVCFFLFLPLLPASEAALAVTGAWRYVFKSGGVNAAFFQSYMGTGTLGASLAFMVSTALGVAGVLALLVAVAWRFFAKPGNGTPVRAVLVFFFTGACTLLAGRRMELDLAFLGLPLWIIAIFAGSLWHLKKASDDAGRVQALAMCTWAVFSFFMLLKTLLSVQLIHYGFVLALPATLLCVCLLTDRLPALLRKHSPDAARICGAGAGGLLAGVVAWFLLVMNSNLAAQTELLGSACDVFRADDRGAALQKAAATLRPLLEPSDTFMVVPESELLNYLLRVRNPTPYGNFNPHQLEIFGEERIVNALAQSPPTFVIWADRIYDEYGADYLGKDYGLQLTQWLSGNYDVIQHLAPGSRLMEARMPILLLRRKEFR